MQHEIDVAFRVNMMGAGHIVHLDYVNADAVRRGGRLQDATEADAPRFATAHPAGCNGITTGALDLLERCAACYIAGIEVGPEGSIEGAVGNRRSNPGDDPFEFVLVHGVSSKQLRVVATSFRPQSR